MYEIEKVKTESHEAWLDLRGKYIGGSDAGAVVGLNPYSSPYALWAQKTGRVPGFSGNLATEVGTYLEDFIAQKFAQETGKKVRRCNYSFLNSQYPFAIANIDREIVGEDAGLECKSTSEMNLKKFKGVEFPEIYYAQCVHYIAVTGKKRWHLAVLVGNREFLTYTLERDEAEIAALMSAERDFWEHVKNDTPPMVDGLTATTNALKAEYPESKDGVVDLALHRSNIERYMAINNQIKQLETLRDEACNQIKEYMGEAWGGECDKYKVIWKSSTRRSFDSKRFVKDNPKLDLSSYYNETTTRTFRVTEIEQK